MDRETDTRPQNATGMAIVNLIVQGEAQHGWQPYAPDNDNGVDGIIIFRKDAVDTGEIIFVQIKCGTGNGYYKATKKRPKHFGVKVGEEYISTHRPRWNALFGPIILVYVDFKTKKAWWTDLKDENSYSTANKSIILVPKEQRFGQHSFGSFKSLKGHLHIDPQIEPIDAARDDIDYLKLTSSMKTSAKEFYNEWATSNQRTHPDLGEIIVSREGWRHICRKGRRAERIIQSWSLLGVAKKMIQSVKKIYQLKVFTSAIDSIGNYVQTDYISLRAQVTFPQRHSSIVQVVLKRKRKFNGTNNLIENKIWFHSVYEPFSRKKIR